MSEPSSRWISIDRSGVSSWREPSMCDWKVTPSSVTLRSLARLITWKPPESVRIGRCQFMNRCRPPSARDPLGAGPQHQVVGVAEDDVGAGRAHVARAASP